MPLPSLAREVLRETEVLALKEDRDRGICPQELSQVGRF